MTKMALEEAIETNSKIKWYVEEKIGKAHAEALQLGIEALEQIKEWRERTDNTKVLMIWRSELHKPLPSEGEG